MSEWKSVAIADIAVDRGLVGGPFGSSLVGKDYVPSGVPVIRGVNLSTEGKFYDKEFVFVSPEKEERDLSRNLAQPGDVVFTQRGTLGQVGIVPAAGFDRYVVSQSQMRLRVNSEVALPEFVYYYFRSSEAVGMIKNHAIATGVPHINLGILGSMRIPLPPLSVQRGICEVLGALDDKIAVNERIGLTYEKLLSAQFAALGIDVEPAANERVPITELVQFNPPIPMPKRSEPVYLDMASVPTASARVQEWTRREPKSGTRFQNGDTVMARITPCLENGKTAFVDFLEAGETGIGSTEFVVLRAQVGVPVHLPYFLARSPRFRGHAIQNMVGSSGRQRVGVESLVDYNVNPCSRNEMAAFDKAAQAGFAHMRSLDAEARTLRELRDTLLRRLMSGAIRVRVAEKVVEDAT